MKFLNPRVHAFIDYAFAIALALAPTLFNFVGIAATLSYVLALAIVVLSLLTRYPLGLIKAIPFQIHGYIELAAGIFALASPWLFGFAEIETGRNFFIGVGILVVAFFAVTDYKQTVPVEERRAAAT